MRQIVNARTMISIRDAVPAYVVVMLPASSRSVMSYLLVLAPTDILPTVLAASVEGLRESRVVKCMYARLWLVKVRLRQVAS